ncbi:MAG: MFS transporter [Desulfobacterales bacterium]
MKPSTSERSLHYRWIIFGVLGLGYIIVYFHRLCPAILALDMMRDLNAGGALIGFLGSAYFYPYAVMQLPAGLLSDSWGARKTVSLFLLIACAGSLLLGLAPSTAIAIIGRTLVGLGVSMLFVPAMKVFSEWFDADEYATVSGLFIAVGGFGSLISATPLAWMSSWIGWRMSFVFIGAVTFVLSVLTWLIVSDRPQDRDAVHSAVTYPGPPKQVITLREGVAVVLSYPRFWAMASWIFFNTTVFFALGGLWGGPYLMHVYNLDKTQSGNILAMLAFGMILGSPVLAYLSTHLFKARKPVLLLSSFALILITLSMTVFTAGIPLTMLFVLFFGIGVFAGAVVSVGFTATKEMFPVQIAGTAIGLVNLFPFAASAVFQPFIGYILERSGRTGDAFTVAGYRNAMLVFCACCAIAFLSTLFVKDARVGSGTADQETGRNSELETHGNAELRVRR